jgi:nicotinate-nucleotide adenylyltransferase
MGVFGGSFDPIHIGHLIIAHEALWRFDLDTVLFVVTAHPPHKQEPEAPVRDRLEMVALAVACEESFVTSRIEIDRGGESYTADTLRELRRLHPDASFYLIVGGDSLLDFSNWKEPETVIQMAHVIAAPRPGFDVSNMESSLEKKTEVFQAPTLAISSTMIRERLHAGQPIRFLVPEPVERYIYERHLYSA